MTEPTGHDSVALHELKRWLILLALYLLIMWSAWPEGASVRHPLHHDDYYALSRSWQDIGWDSIRPVPWAIFAAINHWLPTLAHVVIAVLLVTTAWLALRFAELFALDGARVTTAGLLVAGVLAFGLPVSIDYSAYLGLITNVTSALFGLAAMCFMVIASRNSTWRGPLLFTSWTSALICGFAKEDFAPAMILTASAIAWTQKRRLWAVNAALVTGLSLVGFLKSRLMDSPFVSGAASKDAPYFIDTSISSVVDVAGAYARQSGYFPLLILALVAAAVVLALRGRSQAAAARSSVLTLIAIAPLLPYLLLPNHIFGFYTFYPGVVASAAFATVACGPERSTSHAALRPGWVHAAMLVFACLLVGWYQPQRSAKASWYSDESAYNSRITRFCQQNRALLDDRDVVVHGVSGFSPWHTGSAEYLHRRLGLATRWHLVVRKGESAGGESLGKAWSTSIHAADAIPGIARAPSTAHIVVSPDGTTVFARSLEEAVELSKANPVVNQFLPSSIDRRACTTGFTVVLVGHGLVKGMSINVHGLTLPVSVHRLGDVATCRVPAIGELCELGHVPLRVRVGSEEVLSLDIPIK